jgi:glycosyltransferase involved in cell wall biosynthesis
LTHNSGDLHDRSLHLAHEEVSGQPLISVITVTRNLISQGRQYSFRKALDCVQAQSFHDCEHVVLDGASEDGTSVMIEHLVEELSKTDGAVPVRYVSAPDQGLYHAMNNAVDLARGDYILFLNSDDTLATAEILEDVAKLIDGSRPDFVYGTSLEIDAQGAEKELARTNLKAFLQRMPFCHNSMVIRRSVFKALQGHDLEYRVAADYDFVFRLLVGGYKGIRAPFPISAFGARGVSADLVAVASDYADIWAKFFVNSGAAAVWSREDFFEWYRTGQMPLLACWIAFRKGARGSLLRRASLHSAWITLRRRLQPWRTWDNL